MVQVIRTPRQKAFSDVLAEKIGQAAQLGVGAYQQAQQTARQKALQDRQMAMQEAAIERDQLRYEDQQRRQDEARSYQLAQAGIESTGNFEQDMANLSRIGAENRARSSRLARLKEDEASYLAKQRTLPYEQRDEYLKAQAVAGLKDFAGVRKRTIPGLGLAQTEMDAKEIKKALGVKNSFDRKLDELIKLRKDYGTEYWNRDAVSRSRQLSKQLLLDYKNIAKLGVLSQSDENILNQIIASEPLGHSLGFPGTDPILHTLEKFKADTQADYEGTLAARMEGGDFRKLAKEHKDQKFAVNLVSPGVSQEFSPMLPKHTGEAVASDPREKIRNLTRAQKIEMLRGASK